MRPGKPAKRWNIRGDFLNIWRTVRRKTASKKAVPQPEISEPAETEDKLLIESDGYQVDMNDGGKKKDEWDYEFEKY